MRRLQSVPLVILFALLSIPRIALGQAGTASVFGDVKDQQGANLPGATVTLTSADTGAVRTTVTSQSGSYRFVAIPPGLYSVKVELTGFRTAVHEKLQVAVDTQTSLEMKMELGSLSETVEVTGR